MKVTLTKTYDDSWRNSKEDHSPNIKHPLFKALRGHYSSYSEMHLLSIMRNYFSGVVSYKFIDVNIDDENQIVSVTYPLLRIEDWDFFIDEALLIFNQEIQKRPQILLINETTLDQIESRLPKDKNILGEFKSKNGHVTVCIDNELSDFDFRLVHDEKAEFITKEESA